MSAAAGLQQEKGTMKNLRGAMAPLAPPDTVQRLRLHLWTEGYTSGLNRGQSSLIYPPKIVTEQTVISAS